MHIFTTLAPIPHTGHICFTRNTTFNCNRSVIPLSFISRHFLLLHAAMTSKRKWKWGLTLLLQNRLPASSVHFEKYTTLNGTSSCINERLTLVYIFKLRYATISYVHAKCCCSFGNSLTSI